MLLLYILLRSILKTVEAIGFYREEGTPPVPCACVSCSCLFTCMQVPPTDWRPIGWGIAEEGPLPGQGVPGGENKPWGAQRLCWDPPQACVCLVCERLRVMVNPSEEALSMACPVLPLALSLHLDLEGGFLCQW